MSDMYLVLRRRLETVTTQWVEIETAVLREARTRKGLSYESLARQIPVAAKTYERWEKRGRVPTWHVDKVAELLDLEIERPIFDPPAVRVGTDKDQMVALRGEVAELRELVEKLLRRRA